MRIISSAYATLQRNQRNPGWSERLSIRQQHVGDRPPRVLAQRDVGHRVQRLAGDLGIPRAHIKFRLDVMGRKFLFG